MPEADDAAFVEIAFEVVSACLGRTYVPPAEIPVLIAPAHATSAPIGKPFEPVMEPDKPIPAAPVREAVTDDCLISLEEFVVNTPVPNLGALMDTIGARCCDAHRASARDHLAHRPLMVTRKIIPRPDLAEIV